MRGVLDDMDSRPGSTTSLLRTVIGLYAREAGGWVSTGHLVALMEALDVPGPATRTAMSRVKSKGVIRSEQQSGRAGYAVEPAAQDMLAKGDRRIFHPRQMRSDDPWCVISSTLADDQRRQRRQLRHRLYWIGCGNVSPGTAVCPGYLQDEVLDIVRDLEISDRVTLFISQRPVVFGELAKRVEAWWDLPYLAELHRGFIDACHSLVSPAPTPASSFSSYVRAIDSWRIIPYLDPGLPPNLLPSEWPGTESVKLFASLRATHEQSSAAFVRDMLAKRS